MLIKRLFALAAMVALGLGLALAPQARVAAQEPGTEGNPRHPVAIHAGTCESPTPEPAFDLGEAHLPGLGAEDEAGEGENFRGSGDGVPVLVGNSTIGVTYEDLLDNAQHVIAVHQSAEEFGTIVACGAIVGVVEDGKMTIGIAPVNNSGVWGVARLDEDTEGILGIGDDEVHIEYSLVGEGLITDGGSTSGESATGSDGATPTDTAAATVEAAGDEAADTADDAAATTEGAADEAADEAEDAADSAEATVESGT